MKRIFVLVLAVCLFLLSGCRDSDIVDLPEQSSHIQDILSIRNSDGDRIYYGMTQGDVEAILGQGEAGMMDMYFYENADVAILYRDGMVVLLVLYSDIGWRLTNGIYVGMQVYDQQVFYGKTAEESRQFTRDLINQGEGDIQVTTLDYRFALEGDSDLSVLETVEEYEELRRESLGQDVMRYRFMVSLRVPENTIYLIMFGDQQALFTFR